MTAPVVSRPTDRPSNATPVFIHAAFALTGVMTTLLGPMLPRLSERWLLNDTQSGSLFTAQFTGSMLGVALSGVLIQRYGYRIVLVSGLSTIATGVAILAFALWNTGIASVFCYGIGLGFVIPAGNLLIAEWNPDRRAAALNWLNLSWGVGAAGCPVAVKSFAASPLFLPGIAVVSTILAMALLLPSFALPSIPQKEDAPETIGRIWLSPFVFLLGSLFFLYVGTENCIGGWIASYAQRMTATGTLWALTPSVFWIALLAGRALAPQLLRRVGELRTASLGLALALCGITILISAPTIEILTLGVAISGLGLASVFPINISLLSLRFGDMAPRIGGAMFALAGLGGATLPWFVGVVSTKFGGLKTGLYIPWLGCLTMLALYLLARRSRVHAAEIA